MEPITYDVNGAVRVRIRMRSGDVAIEQTADSQVSIDVTGERDPDEVTIERATAGDGTTSVVLTQRKEGWGFHSRGVRVRVAVPEGTHVDVGSGAGDIAVTGTIAALELRSGSGDATIDQVQGSARVRNASGDVSLRSVGGDAAVTTASGEIRVDSVRGALEARTASGDIEVGSSGVTTRAVSASGDVTIEAAGGDVSLRSVSGDIEVGVPAGTKVWFDVSSTTGDASSDLDPDERDGGEAAFEISATSVSGDIRIRRAGLRVS